MAALAPAPSAHAEAQVLLLPNPAHVESITLKQKMTQKIEANPITPPPEEELEFAQAAKVAQRPVSLLSQPVSQNDIVAVIGVGYVGLHLARAFSEHYNVVAFDVSSARVEQIKVELAGCNVKCTSDPDDLSEAVHFLIAVPTLLKIDKSIDTTYLQKAVETVSQYARIGSTVVVESSVAVGMTRQFLEPLLRSKGLRVGMSPERVDPGRVLPTFETIPKVISGLDNASLERIKSLYSRVFTSVVPVTSPEVAEMTKLYENCQRMMNAAFANEMADACRQMKIDAWEVSNAAASKPFGYIPFRPGLGVGGHCIPVNPFYLLSTCSMPILEHATRKTHDRPQEIVDEIMSSLEKQPLSNTTTSKERTRVLVVGVGFKRGQSVLSHSPGVAAVVRLLSNWHTHVEYADPLVAQDALPYVPRLDNTTCWTVEHLSSFDLIIVAHNQIGLDMDLLKQLNNVRIENFSPS